MRAPLIVAAVQPRCTAKNVAANAREHAALIQRARARVIVFPELSLTGYELDASPVSPDDPSLEVLVDACRKADCTALVGAPVTGAPREKYIGVLRVGRDGISIAYRKSFLGGDERSYFSPGSGVTLMEIDGWRVGLGVCKDTGVEQHTIDTAALNVDVYLAGLVDHATDRGIQVQRARHIAQTCHAYVVFASFAGATGGGFRETAGRSSIWGPTGELLVSAGAKTNTFARARLI